MNKMIKKKAPNLTLPATSGKTVNLQQTQGKNIILYFYPKDATPGCTQEGGDFRDLYKQIQEIGGEVFGVSQDSLSSHEKFKKKQNYPFELISDGAGVLCRAFDVLTEKSIAGKIFKGISRSTFVISKEAFIEKEWREVKVQGHAQEVFDFLKSLSIM